MRQEKKMHKNIHYEQGQEMLTPSTTQTKTLLARHFSPASIHVVIIVLHFIFLTSQCYNTSVSHLQPQYQQHLQIQVFPLSYLTFLHL